MILTLFHNSTRIIKNFLFQLIINIEKMKFTIMWWTLFVLIVHQFINFIFYTLEQYNGIEQKVYSYDILLLIVMLFFYIGGIYVYKPKR